MVDVKGTRSSKDDVSSVYVCGHAVAVVVAVVVVVGMGVAVIADDTHPKVVGSTGTACEGGREDLQAVPPCDGAARFITQLPLRKPVQVPGRVKKNSTVAIQRFLVATGGY